MTSLPKQQKRLLSALSITRNALFLANCVISNAHFLFFVCRPSKLVVDEKMIVVVVQYRLGALGFFSSGDEVLLGNQGLWDQNLALCWVKDNIRAFGGDPDIITIFGESAGSMSVGLQMFSPQSRGLFKRVIMQSGAPQTVASQLQNTIDRKGAFKAVADLLGCKGDSTMELIDCLKQQPAVDFFNKSTEFASAGPLAAMFFPVVDGENTDSLDFWLVIKNQTRMVNVHLDSCFRTINFGSFWKVMQSDFFHLWVSHFQAQDDSLVTTCYYYYLGNKTEKYKGN